QTCKVGVKMKRPFGFLVVMLVSVVVLCSGVSYAQASTGVGIMPGIIRVDKPLLPGSHYNLPSVQVVNTGSEGGQYGVELTRMTQQDELQPPEEFISLNPRLFHLEPGANQVVSLSLDIPVKAKPGDYLAYVEAHVVSQEAGGMRSS
ncbi:hypothetical protein ACFLUU_06955, partial [Chloroflexota bacterium]